MNTQPTRILTLALCTALFALPAYAQEEEAEYQPAGAEAGDMAVMMEAYKEAGTPGAHHAWLAKMAGDWDLTVTMHNMGPEPMTMTAASHSEMIHGGRYLLEQVEGAFMGEPFHGSNVTAYNNTTETYESAWIDNMSTGLYTYTGTREGSELTLWGEMKDPVTRETVKSKSVVSLVSSDRIEMTGFEDRGDGWQKTMEIVYKRKKM